MGWQIIKQEETDQLIDGEKVTPGLFCIRSSIVDALIAFNCDEAEVLTRFITAEMEGTLRDVTRIMGHVRDGEPGKAYHQFVRSWQEVLAEHIRKEKQSG